MQADTLVKKLIATTSQAQITAVKSNKTKTFMTHSTVGIYAENQGTSRTKQSHGGVWIKLPGSN